MSDKMKDEMPWEVPVTGSEGWDEDEVDDLKLEAKDAKQKLESSSDSYSSATSGTADTSSLSLIETSLSASPTLTPQISQQQLDDILSSIKNHKTSSLDLSKKNIGPAEMMEIAKLLVGNTVIRKLNLYNNNLGPEGTRILCDALKKNTHLQELNISWNFIDDGYVALADLMSVNQSIIKLVNNMNHMSPEVWHIVGNAIEEGLKRNNYKTLVTKRLIGRPEEQHELAFKAIDTENFSLALNIIRSKKINPNYQSSTLSGVTRSILGHAICKLLSANTIELQNIIDLLINAEDLDHRKFSDATLLGYSVVNLAKLSERGENTDFVIKTIKKLVKDISRKSVDSQAYKDNRLLMKSVEKISNSRVRAKLRKSKTPHIEDSDQESLSADTSPARKSPKPSEAKGNKLRFDGVSPGKQRLLDEESGGRLPFFAYSSRQKGQEEDQFRQRFVNERYFQVRLNKFKKDSRAEKFYFKIYKTLMPDATTKTVEVNDISGRGFIIVIARLLKNLKYIPTIYFRLGPTFIQCKTGPEAARQNQIGDIHLAFRDWQNNWIAYCYGEKMINKLAELTNNYNPKLEQELMVKMREKIREARSFSHQDFNAKGLIRSPEQAPFIPDSCRDLSLKGKINYKIDFLNFMVLLTYFEIARRLYRDHQGMPHSYEGRLYKEGSQALDQLPMGVLSARATALGEHGQASLTDLFGHSSQYGTEAKSMRARLGPTTGQRLAMNYQSVQEKARNLTDDYYKLLAGLSPWAEFCDELVLGEFIVPSASFMREELYQHLGGRSESDSAALGYSTEVEAALRFKEQQVSSGRLGSQTSSALFGTRSSSSSSSRHIPAKQLLATAESSSFSSSSRMFVPHGMSPKKANVETAEAAAEEGESYSL